MNKMCFNWPLKAPEYQNGTFAGAVEQEERSLKVTWIKQECVSSRRSARIEYYVIYYNQQSSPPGTALKDGQIACVLQV